MVGITSVNLTGASVQSALQTATQAGGTEQGSEAPANQVAMPAQTDKADKAKGSDDSSEPSFIRQLRELIKQMQKQLADAQKRMAEIQAQPMDEKAKLAAVAGIQAQIATISGQIQQATAQLLQALSKLSSSSSGNLISTVA